MKQMVLTKFNTLAWFTLQALGLAIFSLGTFPTQKTLFADAWQWSY